MDLSQADDKPLDPDTAAPTQQPADPAPVPGIPPAAVPIGPALAMSCDWWLPPALQPAPQPFTQPAGTIHPDTGYESCRWCLPARKPCKVCWSLTWTRNRLCRSCYEKLNTPPDVEVFPPEAQERFFIWFRGKRGRMVREEVFLTGNGFRTIRRALPPGWKHMPPASVTMPPRLHEEENKQRRRPWWQKTNRELEEEAWKRPRPKPLDRKNVRACPPPDQAPDRSWCATWFDQRATKPLRIGVAAPRTSRDRPCKVCVRNATPSPSGTCAECSPECQRVRKWMAGRRKVGRGRKRGESVTHAVTEAFADRPQLPKKPEPWRPLNKFKPGDPDLSKEIQKHMRMVHRILWQIRERHNIAREHFPPNSANEEELIQAGRDALAEALMDHDPQKGKFSTLAYQIIPRRLANAINRLVYDIKGGQLNGRGEQPDNDPELGPESGEDTEQAPEEEAHHHLVSDDEFSSQRESHALADPRSTLEWQKEEAERRAWRRRKRKQLARLLPQLPTMERQAVELHHGLADGRSWSLAEIAEHLGLTEADAKQVVDDGIKKLRDLAE